MNVGAITLANVIKVLEKGQESTGEQFKKISLPSVSKNTLLYLEQQFLVWPLSTKLDLRIGTPHTHFHGKTSLLI